MNHASCCSAVGAKPISSVLFGDFHEVRSNFFWLFFSVVAVELCRFFGRDGVDDKT